MISIRLKSKNDNEKISTYLKNNWGSDFVLSKGIEHHCENMQGLIAEQYNSIVGICLYTICKDELEVNFLESFRTRIGVGSALLKEIEHIAVVSDLKRIWTITTNDNVDAMMFYINKGYSFKRIERNMIDEYRKSKLEIPRIGNWGIPIIDELEFEKIV